MARAGGRLSFRFSLCAGNPGLLAAVVGNWMFRAICKTDLLVLRHLPQNMAGMLHQQNRQPAFLVIFKERHFSVPSEVLARCGRTLGNNKHGIYHILTIFRILILQGSAPKGLFKLCRFDLDHPGGTDHTPFCWISWIKDCQKKRLRIICRASLGPWSCL